MGSGVADLLVPVAGAFDARSTGSSFGSLSFCFSVGVGFALTVSFAAFDTSFEGVCATRAGGLLARLAALPRASCFDLGRGEGESTRSSSGVAVAAAGVDVSFAGGDEKSGDPGAGVSFAALHFSEYNLRGKLHARLADCGLCLA